MTAHSIAEVMSAATIAKAIGSRGLTPKSRSSSDDPTKSAMPLPTARPTVSASAASRDQSEDAGTWRR